MHRSKRVALLVGMVLLAVGLAAPTIAAQTRRRSWPGRFSRPGLQAAASRPGSPRHVAGPAAKLFRQQRYLVPDQAGYERAKSLAAARAGRARQARHDAFPKVGPPRIASGGPDIGPNWQGVDDATVTPPDTTGAVGTSRYIELVNDQFAIYDRSGNPLSTGGLQAFAGPGATPDVTDPQVIWDPGTKRFYAVVLDFSGYVGDGTENDLYVLFSRTASPNNGTTDWCKYFLSYGEFLPDYPKLGDSSAFWMIGSNLFAPDYIGSDVAWISKPPSGTGCPPDDSFHFGDLPGPLTLDDGSAASTPVPANQIDSNGTGYVVASPDSSDGDPHTFVDTYTVTKNKYGNAVFGAAVRHDVTSYTLPPSAPQLGTSAELDTLDGRLTNAVVAVDPSTSKTALWTQHTVAGGAGSEVDWYEIVPGTNATLRDGAVADSSLYVFNGAISPDRLVSGSTSRYGDTFVVGFDTSSSADDVRIQMVSQWANKPMSAFADVYDSPGFNEDFTCPTTCRWGDYSGASPDPAANAFSNHGVVWLANQWNVSSGDSSDVDWRTYVWATHPVPYVILNSPTAAFQTSTQFSVDWVLGNQATAADVRYRRAAWNRGFGGYSLFQSQVPGSPGSATFNGSPGNTYCLSAQSYDSSGGHTRPWGFTGERCTVVPLDDRALGASSGWSRKTGTGFFQNTYTQTTGLGKTLSRGSIKTRSIKLMVETCPTCGSIKIYWNNVLQHSYSLHATSVHKLVYLLAAKFKSVKTGTLKVVTTSSGKLVIVDGLGVSAV